MKTISKKRSKFFLSVVTAVSLSVGILAGTAISPEKSRAAISESALVPTKVTSYIQQTSILPVNFTLPGSNGDVNATSESTCLIIPVQVDQVGVLEISYLNTMLADTTNINISLYSDQNCSLMIGSQVTLTKSASVKGTYVVPAAQMYYLKLAWNGTNIPTNSAIIPISACSYSGEEITLTSEYQPVYVGDSTTTKYHKFSISSDSLVTISGNEYNATNQSTNLSFSLLDSSMETLAQPALNYGNSFSVKYALKKGDYYVGVNSANKYQLKMTSEKLTDQSKATAKKATVIKVKKTKKGKVLLSDSETKADWFQIKLTKKKKIQLLLNASCTGDANNLKFEIISGKNMKAISNGTAYLGNGSKNLITKKLKKGVYYIKVTKLYKEYSGSYSIKYSK